MLDFLLWVVSMLFSECAVLDWSRAGVEYHIVLLSVFPRVVRARVSC